jgi:hypothetical protein
MILFIFPAIALIAGFLSADTANAIDPIDPPQRLWPVIRWRVIAVAALVVLIEGMVTLSSIVNEFPLDQPISLDPPGSVDTRIRVRQKQSLSKGPRLPKVSRWCNYRRVAPRVDSRFFADMADMPHWRALLPLVEEPFLSQQVQLMRVRRV